MTIALIIDDQSENILMLNVFLGLCNIDSFGVTSGLEAFAIAKTHPPDIVFLDLRMPEDTWDGYKTCEEFKSHPSTSHIPIVAVTAGGDAQRAYETGFDYFLQRPFKIRSIKEILHEEGFI